jgi:hypothetical protein
MLDRLTPQERNEHLQLAARIPPELLQAQVYSDRYDMLKVLPRGGVVAEVGVWRGDFSAKIIETCVPRALHLIDIDFSPFRDSNVAGAPVVRHEGDSAAILASFAPDTFDWIYVDGDHTYPGVVRDLAAAHKVLKRGGFMMCNDYATWCARVASPFGVARAVNEFVIENRYAVRGLGLSRSSLPDLLLQKPIA